jgi:uncharacterized repeat protein (TIGR03803 family)
MYGAGHQGGAQGYGTIFQVTPAGAITTLYTFTVFPASGPNGVVEGPDGNSYGTVYAAGKHGAGYVFRLTSNGAFTVLHNFDIANGRYPVANLLPANDCNLEERVLEDPRIPPRSAPLPQKRTTCHT